MASTSISTIVTIFSLLLLLSVSSCHNITKILDSDPDFSQFNSYLTQTKLADEINARQTITVLALDNSAMAALTANRPLSVIKNLLSLHILLDYFDNKKLHSIPDGSSLTTSLNPAMSALSILPILKVDLSVSDRVLPVLTSPHHTPNQLSKFLTISPSLKLLIRLSLLNS
ncbi:unnamed protein product [Amaranthus hypochondriacus]